jgi:hypothetical protein
VAERTFGVLRRDLGFETSGGFGKTGGSELDVLIICFGLVWVCELMKGFGRVGRGKGEGAMLGCQPRQPGQGK